MVEGENKLTRTFICFDFPDSVIKETARFQKLIQNKVFTGKVTELENIHLTLKFLGEINEEVLTKVREKLREIKFKELFLKTGYLGTFNRRGNPNLVWLKIEGKDAWDLQKKIDEALKDIFKPEERFMGRVTVARVKYVKDKKGFEDNIKRIRVRAVKFKINSFKLMSSDLGRTGPSYTVLEEYKSN
jgi:RNA 2',3'-cyclic 3'-phosphodiesterase